MASKEEDIQLNTNPFFFSGDSDVKKSSLEIEDRKITKDPRNYMIEFLCCIGGLPIKKFTPTQNKMFKLFIFIMIGIICVYTTFNTAITSSLSSAPSDDDFGDTFDLTCRSSTKMKAGKDSPCILVYSQKLLSPIFSVATLYFNGWIFLFGDNRMVKKHIMVPALRKKINQTTIVILGTFLCVLAYNIIILPLDASENQNVPAEVKRTQILAAAVFAIVANVSIAPFFGISLLVYVEGIYLRDRIEVLKNKFVAEKFHFPEVSELYQNIRSEFLFAQGHFGSVAGVSLLVNIVLCVMAIVQMLYVEKSFAILPFSTPSSVKVLAYLNLVGTMSIIFPPLLFMIKGLILVNDCSDSISKDLSHLLLTLPSTTSLSTKSSSSSSSSSGLSQRVTPSFELRTDATLQVMRLLQYMDRNPCELLILGYRVNEGDIYTVIAFILTVMAASVFGLSWLVG